MRVYTFRTIIELDENNTFHGYVPLLPGCHTYGETFKEARKNLKEAMKCHVQGLLKDGESVPREENSFELIQTFTEKDIALNC